MRLLTTDTIKLVDYPDEQSRPPYAILSHTWGDEEVTFQQMQDPPSVEHMKGYLKIVKACKLALSDSYDYIWIDTCCIDKTSSAELSEVINSMYGYYRSAEVCYAYLADVRGDLQRAITATDLRSCKWFKRGWTLQELLAPLTVVFLADDWSDIGTKGSLRWLITDVTGIPSDVLMLKRSPGEFSIAKRMSWAAGRKTTRVEDRAYSMMGLFGVFMPTIYGEGMYAFIRLQQEILKVSDDQTIFAWKDAGASDNPSAESGLLAFNPDHFGASGAYEPINNDRRRQPYSMSNLGLQIHLRRSVTTHNKLLAYLYCCQEGRSQRLAIHVKRLDGPDGHQFTRVQLDTVVQAKENEGVYEPTHQMFFDNMYPMPFELGSLRSVVDHNDTLSFNLPGWNRGVTLLQHYFHDTVDGRRRVDATSEDVVHFHNRIDPHTRSNSSPTALVLLRYEKTKKPFAVIAGFHERRIWTNIIIDVEMDTSGLVYLSELVECHAEWARWDNTDRVSRSLTDDTTISVEARRTGITGRRGATTTYAINIRIVDEPHWADGPY